MESQTSPTPDVGVTDGEILGEEGSENDSPEHRDRTPITDRDTIVPKPRSLMTPEPYLGLTEWETN